MKPVFYSPQFLSLALALFYAIIIKTTAKDDSGGTVWIQELM